MKFLEEIFSPAHAYENGKVDIILKSITIKNTTPIIVTPPNAEKSKEKDRINTMLLDKHKIDNVDHYVVTGTQDRGSLRRNAIKAVGIRIGRVIEGETELYHLLSIGGVKQKVKESTRPTSPDVLRQIAETNPILEAFGCMSPVHIRGGVRIGHLISTAPIRDVAIEMHVRKSDVTSNTVIDDYFKIIDDAGRDDQEKVRLRARMGELEKAAKKNLKAEGNTKPSKDDVDRVKRALAEANGDNYDALVAASTDQTVAATMPYGSEYIPIGTEFQQTIHFKRMSPRTIGMLIQAMRTERVTGGKSGTGAGGDFVRHYEVLVRDNPTASYVKDGEIRFVFDEMMNFRCLNDSKIIEEAFAAFRAMPLTEDDLRSAWTLTGKSPSDDAGDVDDPVEMDATMTYASVPAKKVGRTKKGVPA